MHFSPIAPYFAIKEKYQPSINNTNRLELHTHSYWQMVTVAYGNGFVTIADTDYPVSAGDIVLFAPNTLHSLFVTDVTMTTYEFKFDINDPHLLSIASTLGAITTRAGEEIIALSRRAVHEARVSAPHSEHLVAYIIAEILLLLSRMCAKTDCKEQSSQPLDIFPTDSQDPCANSIRKYIEENYANDINTKDIAESMFLSTSYVCRKFMSIYKISPMKYISLLRLNKAKQLLESSELSITEISTIVGFSDLHYFSRCFKHYTGTSPSEYRATVRDKYAVSF